MDSNHIGYPDKLKSGRIIEIGGNNCQASMCSDNTGCFCPTLYSFCKRANIHVPIYHLI